MRYKLYSLIVFLGLTIIASGQNPDIPERPDPPHLVNDFAGFLSTEEVNGLEHKLVEFNNSTSTQIAVVIVKSLDGYDKGDFAARIIEKWGIGQKDKNNGLVILIKPKTPDEKGEVFISTGYGVEHLVTDALARSIVDNEIIPSFKQGNFYQGIDKAVNTLISLTKGEYTADQYMAKAKKKSSGKGLIAIIIIVILAFVFFGRKGSGGDSHMSSRGDLPFWVLLGMLGSGSNRGSFGGFSSGGGGFGGSSGGGGFGGFGGGMGGGGGAGGSW
jgi:uncharacterized protein